MTNFEKYEKEIKAHNYKFGVSKSGEFLECENLKNCDKCIFYNTPDCAATKTKWLYQPYAKPIANVSGLDYEFAKLLVKEDYKYIARYKNDELYIFENEPVKNERDREWKNTGGGSFYFLGHFLSQPIFPFAVWENEKPTFAPDIIKAYEEEHKDV